MLTHTRLILAAFVVSSTLVACGDNETSSTESSTTPVSPDPVLTVTAPTASTSSTISATQVEVGMSEQAAADLLGEKSFSETKMLDKLTITHTEWSNAEGITSVQFHDGKAVFSQFVAAE